MITFDTFVTIVTFSNLCYICHMENTEDKLDILRVRRSYHRLAKAQAAKVGTSLITYIENLIQGNAGFTAPPMNIPRVATIQVDETLPLKKLPPMDDWGNPLDVIRTNEIPVKTSPLIAREKLAKIAKSLKTDDRCPHGIAKSGYCKACGGLAK